MLKRLAAAVLFLAVMCGVFTSSASWGAATVRDYPYTSSTDIASLYGVVNNTYGSYLYNLYGQDAGFNYQLRELTGTNTAGSQWFATVYENYFYSLYNAGNNTNNRGIYRRTMGGEIPEITVSSVGNLIGGFNFMTLEEPQPYTAITNIYDEHPDPLESLCLVVKNGTGNFNVDFGNPYASHYPYWWRFGAVDGSALWNNRANVRSLNEPVAFLINISEGLVSARDANGNYTDMYTFTLSNDINKSGDVIGNHYEFRNMAGKLAYKTSHDHTVVLDSKDNTVYTVSYLSSGTNSGASIYDSAGKLAYTLEASSSANIMYLCKVRDVTESIAIDGFEDYSFIFTPRGEQSVNPADYASTNVRISSTYGTTDFGSTLGYITFNQAADMATGYSHYRENATIPLVIANVYDGNASEVPLQFDMTVYDSATQKTADHVINRVKFTWDAQSDMNDLDFGTFFMVQSSADPMPTYYLETQITNRTATRYRLYRYDMLGRTSGYQEIRPDRWKYDLPLSPTQLQRETLPQYFHLDAHSQIAPGLVTVYDHSVYGTVNTAYDTYESFQINDYVNSAPRNLRLNYKRVRGLDLIAGSEEKLDGVRTREFVMNFADVVNNDEETAYELMNLMGKPPVMTTASVNSAAFTAAASSKGKAVSHDRSVYINSSAIDAFRFVKTVPEGLVTYTIISEDTESQDTPSQNPEPAPENPPEDETNASAFSPSEVIITLVSNEIPLQPLSIRMRIPRQNQLVMNHWEEFENAASSRALFNAFANYGTIWLRSDATSERDANFFTAINNKGSNIGAGAADCIRAFIYEDALYLDFIVILADGSSRNTGKTAYVELFRDDENPYVLIGDGNENGQWDMTFYIAATGENPTPRPSTPTSGDNSGGNNSGGNDGNSDSRKLNSGSGGGGGCSLGLAGMLGMILLLGILKLSRV
ncbi:MAG: hypothetical protein IJU26_02805 [Synergistaceae bacterium]|nr:hypothetical protein [Synergistaceae bacterium]